jgi:hypothetical protein
LKKQYVSQPVTLEYNAPLTNILPDSHVTLGSDIGIGNSMQVAATYTYTQFQEPSIFFVAIGTTIYTGTVSTS